MSYTSRKWTFIIALVFKYIFIYIYKTYTIHISFFKEFYFSKEILCQTQCSKSIKTEQLWLKQNWGGDAEVLSDCGVLLFLKWLGYWALPWLYQKSESDNLHLWVGPTIPTSSAAPRWFLHTRLTPLFQSLFLDSSEKGKKKRLKNTNTKPIHFISK